MTEVVQRTAQGLRFTVLCGTVGAEVDGESVALGGPMQRKLLAALLAGQGSTVSADRLVESIWPEDQAPDGARRTVMSYVSRLRSTIGGDHLVTRDAGYQLVLDGAGYDAAEFELALAEARASSDASALDAYGRALALWSGRAFGEDAAEWWLQPVAARLEELRLIAEEERADLLIELGRHGDAVVELEQLVAEQPLRERFVDLLMRSLYLGGRQAEALRAYRHFHDYLADETGLDPSEDLVELEHRITMGDASLAPASSVAVPGYELGEVIGVGAFGSVYRATQPSIGREVAIKVVLPELADDPRFVQRFEAEAQLVARIEHPHVVPLYDYWRRPGGAFLVFRLLRGGTLADRIAVGPMPLEDVDRIVTEMCGALGAAHALGVVHRDVKPANVIFDELGNSYLADFGIAVDAAGAADDPELRAAGSPMYASPEQARDGVATAVSDQYALAVVAWEALTAAAPFPGGSTTEVLRSKFTATVPDLSSMADVPEAVARVLQRATSPGPADRLPTIEAFAEAWQIAVTSTRTGVARTTGELDGGSTPRAASVTMASLPVVGANPFKGLRAFRESDANEFHGRTALVERLVAAIAEQPFTVVVGPSGSGKSSLVHAGVVPALRRTGALVVSMVPGSDPTAELEAALRRVATLDDETAIGARLRTPGGLVAIAADLVEPGGELVLVVDQFEELFTLAGSAATRDRFIDLLAHGTDASGPLRVVATLRADLYDRPLQHPALGPLVSDATFAVTPMTPAELAEAVEEPAAAVGVRFEPGLAATIVNDVGRRPGALPLLQFSLTELFELRTNATITTRAYEQLGGLGGALASRAEQLYRDLDVELHGDVRRLFLQLVAPGEGSEDLRRRATPPELEGIDRSVIEGYRDHRLLVTDHHPITREPTLEVAHEALLREWPRLRGWIDGAQGTIRQRRTLEVDANAWDEQGRDESALLRGSRLVAATEVAEASPLTAVEREFLAASEALADHDRVEAEARLTRQARENRRLRRLVIGVAIALVVAMVAGALALDQRGQARDAADRAERNANESDVRRLVAEAERSAPTSPDLSMLLAVEAAKRSPGPATAGALATAMLTDPDLVRYEGDTGRPRTTLPSGTPGDWPAFSPDGSQAAVPDSEAGEIRIVDVLTGKQARRLPIPTFDTGSDLAVVAWSTDGTIEMRTDDSVAAIDAETGTVRTPPTSLGGTIGAWEPTEDGRRTAVIATGSGDHEPTLTVLDRDGGRRTVAMPCCAQPAQLGPAHLDQTLVGSLAWRGDDLYVAPGNGALAQVDPDSGRTVRTIDIDLPWVYRTGFSAKGDRLYMSGQEAQAPGDPSRPVAVLQAFDTATWKPLWDDPPQVTGFFADDPDHGAVRAVNAFGGENAITIDRATGEVTGREFAPTNGPPCGVEVSPGARFLAAAPCDREAITVWSLDGDGAIARSVGPGIDNLPYLTVTKDGTRAVVTVDAGAAYDIDLRTGTQTTIPGVAGAAALPDGRLAVFSLEGLPGISKGPVEVPSKATDFGWGAEPLDGVNGSDSDVAHDLSAVGTKDNRTVEIYRGLDHIGSVTSEEGNFNGFLLLGDSDRLIMGTVASEVLAYPLDDLSHPEPAGFTANSLATGDSKDLLVTGASDGSFSFRDPQTFRLVGPSIAGIPPAARAALTPDDRTVMISSSRDSSVRIFDVETAGPLGPPIPIDSTWQAVTPSHDNRFILIWRAGHLVKLSIDRNGWLDAACRAAGRNLTKVEWKAHIGGQPEATCPQYPAPK